MWLVKNLIEVSFDRLKCYVLNFFLFAHRHHVRVEIVFFVALFFLIFLVVCEQPSVDVLLDLLKV